MKLVVDTNILLSALIRDAKTREILVKSGWDFYYPESSLHELRKYESLVLEKSGMDRHDYRSLLELLFRQVTLVSEESILPFMQKAKDIMGAPW